MSLSLKKTLPIVVILGIATVGFLIGIKSGLLDTLLGNGDEQSATSSHPTPLYTCPMHPEVVQNEPGSCPICKMDLVQMGDKRAKPLPEDNDVKSHISLVHQSKGKNAILNGFELTPEPGTRAFCPVMQNDFTVKDDSASSEYQGRLYLFCCPGCKPMFEEDPERYIEILKKKEAQLHSDTSSSSASNSESAPDEPSKILTIDPVVVQHMGVRIATANHGPIFRHIRTIGEVIVAEDEVSVVNLRFSGWIEKIYVDQTGQAVKKGDPLFAVYSPELVTAQEEYLLAVRTDGEDSRLARATARRLELWGIGKGHLKRVIKNGKAQRNLIISAPRSGYILHKKVVQGGRIQAGADLYRIGDLDRIWVNGEIYDHDAPWIRVGQNATMEFSFMQGKQWNGTVSYVYPTLNPRTRTLTVRLEFENPGLNLKPGMLATVRIETRKKDHAVIIPSEAIIYSGERRMVFVARGYGKYEPREVTVGLIGDNNLTEILDGLTKGEEVVVSGQFLLDSESQLQEAVQKLMESRLQTKQHPNGYHPTESSPGLTYWTCPMHPEIVEPKFDTCPKCGMDLVEKKR